MRTNTRLCGAIVAIALGFFVGCGAETRLPTRESAVHAQAAADEAPADDVSAPAAKASAVSAAGLNRKIIYTARVDLAVDDFDAAARRVVELVKQFEGYLADSEQTGTTGQSRRGTWTLRVPVAHFENCLDAVKNLGELQSAALESQDVSEEYYDVDARVRTKSAEEARLLELLATSAGKLEDVLTIERALAMLREETERMQGRLRVLADLTSLTTIHLAIAEVHGYVPPQNPTFTARVERAFWGSLGHLREAGEDFCVAAVAVAPWLALLAVSALPFYALARVALRRRARREAQSLAAGS